MLVSRCQGNVLDNPLLSVLLPGVSDDCLAILTCIGACCFGCSSERRQRPTAASSSLAAATVASSRSGTAKGTPSQDLELLMSVAPSIRYRLWQMPQPQEPSAAAPRTRLSCSSRASNSAPFAQLDESVDRLRGLRGLRESPAGKPSLVRDSTTSTSPPPEARRTASATSRDIGHISAQHGKRAACRYTTRESTKRER